MLDLIKKVTGIGGTVPSVSPSKKLDEIDWLKLGRNGLLVGVSAAVTYLSQHLTGVDFGSWNVIIVPALSGLLDLIRRWLADNTKTDEVKK